MPQGCEQRSNNTTPPRRSFVNRAGVPSENVAEASPALIVVEVTFMKRRKRPVSIKKNRERSEMVFVGFERSWPQAPFPPWPYSSQPGSEVNLATTGAGAGPVRTMEEWQGGLRTEARLAERASTIQYPGQCLSRRCGGRGRELPFKGARNRPQTY